MGKKIYKRLRNEVFISYSNAQRLETAMKNYFMFWKEERIGRRFINLSNFENWLCDKIFGKIFVLQSIFCFKVIRVINSWLNEKPF